MNKLVSTLLLNPANKNSKAGFTLVEILLVVAILGILAGVAVVSLKGRTKTASIQATRTSIQAIGTAIDTYEVDNGIYPQSLQNLLTKGNESNWNGPYMKDARMPKDAWGTDFSYSLQGENYKLSSAGPDGQSGSADDITN
jgi:general secretion pathway protein G